MKWMDNVRIGVRLSLGFGAVIALLLVLAGVGVSRMSAVIANTELILHDRYAKVALAHAIENEVNLQARAMQTALITTDIALVQTEIGKVEEADRNIDRAVDGLKGMSQPPGDADALAQLVKSRGNYSEHKAELIKYVIAQSLDEGGVYLIQKLLPAQNAYLATIALFNRAQSQGMEQFGEDATRTAKMARVIMLGLAIAAAALAIGVAFFMTRSITSPISQAVVVAQTVAYGDLTSHIDVKRSDEAGQLLSALDQMNDGLAGIVRQVRESSEAIATGASQIASGNWELSRRTEVQATSLQRTAFAMEQVTAMSAQSAHLARIAAGIAQETRVAATNGGDAVHQMIAMMQEIKASSRKISAITGLIDAIAAQTNILALNAAVEGARAGDQGRGFSVVASEVRTLAHRAAEAAKDIKALIADSVERTDMGARIVEEAGMTMQGIVDRVNQVAKLISEINASAHTQTVSFGQVSHAVSELDQTTQKNAALVEESAAASDSLSNQSAKLAHVVHSFRLAEMPGSTPALR